MENASKALLIAGGVLMAILIASLLIFAWTRFTDFYNNEDDLSKLTDISEFNLQFTNYQNRDVYGYELISLANKVADYNTRFSTADDNKSNDGYNPITMTISFPGTTAQELWYDLTPRTHFFEKGANKTQSKVNNEIIAITNESKKIEDFFGDKEEASKVVKNLSAFSENQVIYYMNTRNLSRADAENYVVSDYNSIVKTATAKATSFSDIENKIKNVANLYEYYEYYQFKKGIFECTDITYDNTSNRVSTISFVFTGKIE